LSAGCRLVLVLFGLTFAGCRHKTSPPAPAASAAAATQAAGTRFTDETRALHFAAEKQRATEIWAKKPSLPECLKVLHEAGDAELCNTAASALLALEVLPADAASERLVPALADGSLALARLSQRARYQSLVEISQRRMTGDAGAPPASSASATALRALHPPRSPLATHQEQPVLDLNDGPASQLLATVLRLERDTLRNLGAYLEYAPAPERRLALNAVKQLRATRPQWQQLDKLIREAMLLEADPALKQDLAALVASGLPRGSHVSQPAVSK